MQTDTNSVTSRALRLELKGRETTKVEDIVCMLGACYENYIKQKDIYKMCIRLAYFPAITFLF